MVRVVGTDPHLVGGPVRPRRRRSRRRSESVLGRRGVCHVLRRRSAGRDRDRGGCRGCRSFGSGPHRRWPRGDRCEPGGRSGPRRPGGDSRRFGHRAGGADGRLDPARLVAPGAGRQSGPRGERRRSAGRGQGRGRREQQGGRGSEADRVVPPPPPPPDRRRRDPRARGRGQSVCGPDRRRVPRAVHERRARPPSRTPPA